ncbi:MAG: class I SAM-dependent methyltransferase [Filomicrobium sp.]
MQSTADIQVAGKPLSQHRTAKSETTMSKEARFWDRIAEGYARKPVADEAAYQKKLKVTQEYLRDDMNVLEFGCGTGSTSLVHAPFVKHIDAVDISSKMIEIAKGKAAAGNVTNVRFSQSGIEELDAADGSYDAMLGLSVLHLLEDPQAAISKVHRLLKPGGVFVSSTACLADMNPAFRLILPIGYALGFVPRVQIMKAATLKDDLAHAGFKLDYEWTPGPGKGIFLVAKKPG